MAGPGLFIHTVRGPNGQVWEAGGLDLWPWPPNSTPCIFACPSVLLPFHVGGPRPGGEGGSGKTQRLSVCKPMTINTTYIPPDCPLAWSQGSQAHHSQFDGDTAWQRGPGCIQNHTAGQGQARPGPEGLREGSVFTSTQARPFLQSAPLARPTWASPSVQGATLSPDLASH